MQCGGGCRADCIFVSQILRVKCSEGWFVFEDGGCASKFC